MFNVELNNVRRDTEYCNASLNKTSPVVEKFTKLTEGKTGIEDGYINHFKKLGEAASKGDLNAQAELNTIRRYSVEPIVTKEINGLLSLFGEFESVEVGTSIEREVQNIDGELSREQANGGDVVLSFPTKNTYPVATKTISAGIAVDYRKIAKGDFQLENAHRESIIRDIRNKAVAYVVKNIIDSIDTATGIKYSVEGFTKTGLDKVVTNVRRLSNGRTTILGDYSMVSQISEFSPFNNSSVPFLSDDALEIIRKYGILDMYNGSVVAEIPNAYNFSKRTSDGKNFATYIPQGVLFVLPSGISSPVKSWTRGGLTSCTGLDVTTGKMLTRYDLEIATDLAKGREFQIGLVKDPNITE